MKQILVTGGSGFIGSNFILYMLGRHDDIFIVNLDLLTYAGNPANLESVAKDERYRFIRGDVGDRALLDGIFAEHGIDTVIHFAAESHVDRSIDGPEVFVKTNTMGTATLLEAARSAWELSDGGYPGNVKYLQVSTDEVYGSLGPDGLFSEDTPLDPHSPYSASKASADLLVKAYYDTFGMPVNISRCSNNYGPYQFLEKLIPLMINNCLNHRPLPVYGDGLQIRDWLYVDDHCGALDLIARNARPGEVYNIAGNNERTNYTIVKTIIAYMHDHVDDSVDETLIKHVEDRKGHDRRYGIDASKINRDLGWQPDTGFEEGIVRTIRWYVDNPEWVRNVCSGEYLQYYAQHYGN